MENPVDHFAIDTLVGEVQVGIVGNPKGFNIYGKLNQKAAIILIANGLKKSDERVGSKDSDPIDSEKLSNVIDPLLRDFLNRHSNGMTRPEIEELFWDVVNNLTPTEES